MKSTKLLTLASLAFSILLSGCSKEPLQRLENLRLVGNGYANVHADFCMENPSPYKQRLKYVFILDKSSSNQVQPGASDPFGFRRYAPLSSFLQSAIDDPGYTYYSLINFSDTATVVQNLTDDRLAFNQVIQSEWNRLGPNSPQDIGFTNYLAAITAARDIIKADLDAEYAKVDEQITTTSYMIVFISDGAPEVQDPSQPNGVVLQKYDPDIKNTIAALLALKTDVRYKEFIDRLMLDTGYYFETNDITAQTLLTKMAAQAGGDTYLFGAGRAIDYTLFALPIRDVKYILSDVFVENASTVWWDDGRLLRDSDNDGLPDEIEYKLGSDPNARDSDGNGVSDSVEFRLGGKPCAGSYCDKRIQARNNYAACSGLMPDTMPGGGPNPAPDGVNPAPWGTVYFADRDRDRLNDCEEWLLRSDRNSFDSNSDHIVDWLGFKLRLPFINGFNLAEADSDADGVRNYDEAKLHTPPSLQNSKLPNFQAPTYHMERVADQDGLACFQLNVDKIATIGWDNLIRVYLVENTSVVDNKPHLRVAEKRLVDKSSSISFFGDAYGGEFK